MAAAMVDVLSETVCSSGMLGLKTQRSLALMAVLCGGAVALPWAWAQNAKPSPSAAAMAKAATALVASLSEEQKGVATFSFEAPGRTEWHFVPQDRPGLTIKAMSPAQRKLAHALLKTGLSAAGYQKTTAIMSLERVLAQMENNPVRRDPEKYYFSVFGVPQAEGTWGWKAEGHHVSLNFTVVKGTLIASTPLFLGANPGEVRQGPRKGTRVLGKEEDEGRRFLMSLTEDQRQRAIFDQTAPPDVVTGAASKADPLTPVGLPAAELTPKQAQSLMDLLKLYATTVTPALASARMARVTEAGANKLVFGWAGGTKRGDPHYYRIAGPSFVVEYDNTQNEANHVHTVWRDYNNDFGRDLLRQHLSTDHK